MAIIVSENDRYKSYIATSGQVNFTFDFPILDQDSVGVIQNGTELSRSGGDFTVSGVGVDSGGTITLTVGATEDDSIIVYGKTPYAREETYTGTYVTPTPANTSEEKIQFQLQQLNRDLNRCVRNDLTDGATTELPSVADRKNNFASWDSDGKLSYSDPTTGALADYMRKDQNLSDVSSVSTARTNLGLGDSATKNIGIIAGTVASGSDSRFLTTSQKGGLTGGTTTDASSLHTHSNLLAESSLGQPNGVAELNNLGKLKVSQIPSDIVTSAATGSSDSEIVIFNSTSGTNIKNSGKTLPSGEIIGTTDTQTLTNKSVDADNNTISNLEVDNLKAGVLDTDLTSTSASDDTIPSAKATKAYADTKAGSVTNIGTGTGIGYDILSGDLKLKTIKAGVGVVISEDTDDITINSVGEGGGFTNFSNVGTGEGKIFRDISLGTTVNLKTIKSGAGVTVTNNADDIALSIAVNPGFDDLTESTVSFVDGTRTYSITPTGSTFSWRDRDGNEYSSSGDSVVIDNTDGLHFVYYNGSTLTSATGLSRSDISDYLAQYIGVGFIQWNATDGLSVIDTDFRYTQNCSIATRINQSFNHQINPYSRCTLGDDPSSGGTVTPSGNLDTDAQFSMSAGELLFVDRRFDTSAVSVGGNWRVAYMDGLQPTYQNKTSFAVLQDTDFSTTTTGRLVYNNSGVPTVVGNGNFVWYFIGVANNITQSERYISVMGQNEYSTALTARNNFETEVLDTESQFSIKQEFSIKYGILFQTSGVYTNSVSARIRDVKQVITTAGFIEGTTIPSELIDGSDASSLHNHENLYLEKSDNLSDLADAATARTNLGLGTIATQDANNVSISGGSISGITDLAITDGGTGASTATAGFDNLAPTTTKGDVIVSDGTNNIRLAVGTNDYVLTADSSQASGVKWGSSAGRLLQIDEFTSSGTWTKPTGCNAIIVRLVGAGGAGGGADASNSGAGGGAGGFSQKHITSGIGSTETVTIGSGGTGVSGGTGGSGGTTSFGTHCSATGGNGGGKNAGGASGGLGSGGDLNLYGGGSESVINNIQGGQGGGSYFGGGAAGAGGGSNGISGGAPGGGGSGAGQGATTGGDGQDGLVVVESYS